MLIKYQIQNSFIKTTGNTIVVSGGTFTEDYKSIVIPIGMTFLPVDYAEDVNKVIETEVKKAINPYFDAETTKYIYPDKDLTIEFRFWDSVGFFSDYVSAGFNETDIRIRRKGFKNSFFRLYFYDSNDTENSELLFTEDLDVGETKKPKIDFNELYWLRNDDFFIKNNTNRTVYMEAKFFNAKIGKILTFINLPLQYGQIDISDYVNNLNWRRVPIVIKNPKLNTGYYNFSPNNGSNNILLTQLVID
jgi:hypothetical protein